MIWTSNQTRTIAMSVFCLTQYTPAPAEPPELPTRLMTDRWTTVLAANHGVTYIGTPYRIILEKMFEKMFLNERRGQTLHHLADKNSELKPPRCTPRAIHNNVASQCVKSSPHKAQYVIIMSCNIISEN